jgi:hypothetical protein
MESVNHPSVQELVEVTVPEHVQLATFVKNLLGNMNVFSPRMVRNSRFSSSEFFSLSSF